MNNTEARQSFRPSTDALNRMPYEPTPISIHGAAKQVREGFKAFLARRGERNINDRRKQK